MVLSEIRLKLAVKSSAVFFFFFFTFNKIVQKEAGHFFKLWSDSSLLKDNRQSLVLIRKSQRRSRSARSIKNRYSHHVLLLLIFKTNNFTSFANFPKL